MKTIISLLWKQIQQQVKESNRPIDSIIYPNKKDTPLKYEKKTVTKPIVMYNSIADLFNGNFEKRQY